MKTNKKVYVVSLKISEMTEDEYKHNQHIFVDKQTVIMKDETFLVDCFNNSLDAHTEIRDILMKIR